MAKKLKLPPDEPVPAAEVNMKYGLIGERLGHSFSREVHALLGNYNYEIHEVGREELCEFMSERTFSAINVTIPYKEDVIPYLTYISDEARAIGAVNTIVNKNGELYGYNTDFFGMRALIDHIGITLCGKKVLILGSGGTAKTARAVAHHLGARSVITVSRGANGDTVSYDEMYEHHTDAEILINTTPVGMYPNNGSTPVSIDAFKNLLGVVDAIYNPIRTKLVREAKKRGIPAEGGLYMLVAQGVCASEIFTGQKYPKETTDEVFDKIRRTKENIVLVGMPSSGKTTVARVLAQMLNLEYADTDDMIAKAAGKSIPEIFKLEGESSFRDRESVEIANISVQNGMIIATGGGAVLREENIDMLKQNGKIFFLDRPVHLLIPTSDRPLTSDIDAIYKRYNERYEVYKKCADVTVDASKDIESVAEQIIGGF